MQGVESTLGEFRVPRFSGCAVPFGVGRTSEVFFGYGSVYNCRNEGVGFNSARVYRGQEQTISTAKTVVKRLKSEPR